MKTVTCKGKFGIVLDGYPARDGKSPLSASAHLILDRYSIDDHGHISLTDPSTVTDVFDAANTLKCELDALVDEVLRAISKDCALHLEKADAASNDNNRPHPLGGEVQKKAGPAAESIPCRPRPNAHIATDPRSGAEVMSPSEESEFKPLFQVEARRAASVVPNQVSDADIKAGIAAVASLATGIEHLANALIAVSRDQSANKGDSGSRRSKNSARRNS